MRPPADVSHHNIEKRSLHPFIRKVNKTIKKFEMLQPGERVVVAVSGGADSLALLQALSELRQEYRVRVD